MATLLPMDEIKEYLQITGFAQDALIASIASNMTGKMEQDTGRVFSVQSNTTYRYSTDGQSSLIIHDRPVNDATRQVRLSGVDMVEDESVWFIPDRRNNDVSVTIQLQRYDQSDPRWYLNHSMWFDKNLDSPNYRSTGPLDLEIAGTVGHPQITGDVRLAFLEGCGFYFHRAKGGASSYAATLTNEEVDLALMPQAYQDFVKHWTIRTAVSVVG